MVFNTEWIAEEGRIERCRTEAEIDWRWYGRLYVTHLVL